MFFIRFVIAAAAAVLWSAPLAGAIENPGPTERVQNLMTLDRPLVIAHRGFKMAAPENTLPAFDLALLAHADLVEVDYYHSSDGVPFVVHDSTLDRTTNADELWDSEQIRTTSKTWAELQELDAGSWFSSTYAGTPLPSLSEALDRIQPRAVTLIERKEGDATSLVELLRRKEILRDVIIQAFDWSFIGDCRALDSNVVLGALGPPGSVDGRRLTEEERYLNNGFLDQIEAAGAQVVGWNTSVTKEAIDEAHRRGLRVWVYTINELDLAKRLIDMGVDGIISDNPAMTLKALAARK